MKRKLQSRPLRLWWRLISYLIAEKPHLKVATISWVSVSYLRDLWSCDTSRTVFILTNIQLL